MAERTKTMLLTLTTPKKKYPLVLPAAEEQLEQAKQALEVEDFSQAVIAGVEYVVPYLNRLIPMDRVTVEDANELAEYLQQFSEDEIRTYWAALEVEEPDAFPAALDIAIDLDDYTLVPNDECEYGREALRRLGADDELLDTIDGYTDFDCLGRDMMKEDGVRRTGYGLIRRLSKPFPEPQTGIQMM